MKTTIAAAVSTLVLVVPTQGATLYAGFNCVSGTPNGLNDGCRLLHQFGSAEACEFWRANFPGREGHGVLRTDEARVPAKTYSGLYTYTGKEGRAGELVELTGESRQFLIEYRRLVDYVAVSEWVRFTEQFTAAPKLHDKIDGTTVRRGAVSQWRNALLEIQNGKCFYDETHEVSAPEVDHVLPWSFVLEDKTWNLVLACRRCNNEKRDRLTNLAALELLCARNDGILKGNIHTNLQFHRHFDEWHSRNIAKDI